MRNARRIAALTVFLSVPVAAHAEPRIELYTMGPGDALFSKFGHAALCVIDDARAGGGLCYNYGTTDFSRPVGLAWDVVRGRAKFWVSVSDWIGMTLDFQAQDRTIYRQVLPFSAEQVASLASALETDALPENREYIYSHFLDNCSTRPRDLINEATGGALARTSVANDRTYRDFAREGFAAFHWTLVPGGDLILGRWVDRDIDTYAAMFIPSVLAEAVEAEFGVSPVAVYEREQETVTGNVGAALARFWVLAVVVGVLAWVSRRGAALSVAVIALLGIIVWAGAILSPWPELRVNELTLVFVPFDVLLWRAPRPRYILGRAVLLALVAALALAGVFVQPLWPYWLMAAATIASFGWRRRKDILAR